MRKKHDVLGWQKHPGGLLGKVSSKPQPTKTDSFSHFTWVTYEGLIFLVAGCLIKYLLLVRNNKIQHDTEIVIVFSFFCVTGLCAKYSQSHESKVAVWSMKMDLISRKLQCRHRGEVWSILGQTRWSRLISSCLNLRIASACSCSSSSCCLRSATSRICCRHTHTCTHTIINTDKYSFMTDLTFKRLMLVKGICNCIKCTVCILR